MIDRTFQLPPPLTEADVIDLVEGSLPVARREAVKDALRGRPELAGRLHTLVEGMKRDRALLARLPEIAAPPQLMEAVQAALERHALLGLSATSADTDELPVSAFKPVRTGWSNPAIFARRMALAAGLLLLVTGASFWGGVLTSRQRSTPGTPGPIAIRDSGSRAANPAPAAPDAANAAPPAIVIAETSPDLADEPAATAVIASLPPAPELSAAQAAALAREGRLLLRAVPASPRASLIRLSGRLAHIAKTPIDETLWRLNSEVPSRVVAALDPEPDAFVRPAAHDAPAVASQDDAPERLVPRRTNTQFHLDGEDFRAVYLVNTPATAAGMDALVRGLRDEGLIVRFEALEQPVELPAAAPWSALPILWWTHGPDAWSTPISVPMVFEPARN